jgi:ribonuclease BN (tRNA processing enzyme)
VTEKTCDILDDMAQNGFIDSDISHKHIDHIMGIIWICQHMRQGAYAKDSTWLLHEAFCLHGQADIFHPYEKHHSTVKDACELTEQLHVKNLLLYHTEDRNLAKRKELYTEEGKRYYHGNLYVPDDLEKLSL